MTPPLDNEPAPQSSVWRWAAFGLVFIASVIILLTAPRSIAVWLLLMLVVGAVFAMRYLPKRTTAGLADSLRAILLPQSEQRVAITLPQVARWQVALEIGFVVIIACLATDAFLVNNPTQTLGGGEVEWQVHSAYMAAITLREKGYIPLWNPWIEFGHPLINNPQSIIFNPFSTGPALIWGGVYGIKLGVVIGTILAGVGGWFLGRVLSMQILGRVLLGLLLIGKGNMLAMIGTGYYPLGISQAYFPWVIAGAIGIVRLPRERWPIGLTALSFILMFWAGNIWYTLPLLFNVALLALVHIVRWDGWKINWPIIRHMLLMAVFTVGIGAVSLLPIWSEQQYMGGHPNETKAGVSVNTLRVLEQFVNGSLDLYDKELAPGEPQFYYSYIAPSWLLLTLFVIVPLLWPLKQRLHQPAQPQMWRIWGVGVFMFVFCTVWGAGGSPIFIWLYAHVPLLPQWRFVGRALAVASFWLAILIALRVDSLWRFLLHANIQLPDYFKPNLRKRLAAALLVLCALASFDLIRQWDIMSGTVNVNLWKNDVVCISWLRLHNPHRPLAVFRHGYSSLITFFNNHVRETTLEADYQPLPMPSTLTRSLLLQIQPEFGVATTAIEREVLVNWGYTPVIGSPSVGETEEPCLYRRPDALAYAYSVRLPQLRTANRNLAPIFTKPITNFERNYDHIRLWVQLTGQDPQVVTIQELAYPGWEVYVDGKPAKLEVAGGQLAVVLPPDNTPRMVDFLYRPHLVFEGARITFITSALFVLYLLRVDVLLPRLWRRLRRRNS